MVEHLSDSTNEDFEVLEENWEVLTMFMRCQTQWNISFNGVMTGLDYTSVIAMLNLICPNDEIKESFEHIQLIEMGAVKKANDIARKNRG